MMLTITIYEMVITLRTLYIKMKKIKLDILKF